MASLRKGILLTVAASIAVYSLLFGTGTILYGEFGQLPAWATLFLLGGTVVYRLRGAL